MIELSYFDTSILISAALLTSAIAGVIGQGGGLMLFALLAVYLDAPILIVFHGAVQLSSNASRAVFAMPFINWRLISPIILGTVLGAALITPLLTLFNWQWMKALMGCYILYMVWGSGLSGPVKIPKPMLSLGLIQGSLGMILGATGPLGNALLFAKGLKKDAIIANNAVIMSVSHCAKIILFGFLGVNLWQDLGLVSLFCVAAILGSYVGNNIRGHLAEKSFRRFFKLILTLMALRMLASVVLDL